MDKIRVMLADDNRSLLKLLSDYLNRQEDIEWVGAVSDGMEIPEKVIEWAPDLLVMDIIMPRQDGFMALEKLGEPDFPVKPRVIVLTGLARDDFIMRAIRLGASYYMVKPFDMNLLYARIVEIAGERQEAPAQEREGGESVDEQITNLFLTLGIPAHIKGYQYLPRGGAHGAGKPRHHQPHHQGAVSRHRPPGLTPPPAGVAGHAPRHRGPGPGAGWKP